MESLAVTLDNNTNPFILKKKKKKEKKEKQKTKKETNKRELRKDGGAYDEITPSW